MSETQNINGKETAVGDTVLYTSHEGRQQHAVITALEGIHADLEAEIDGIKQKFTHAPHNISGDSHSWDHVKVQKPAETPPPDSESAEEVEQSQEA
jgi:hypothetical protein